MVSPKLSLDWGLEQTLAWLEEPPSPPSLWCISSYQLLQRGRLRKIFLLRCPQLIDLWQMSLVARATFRGGNLYPIQFATSQLRDKIKQWNKSIFFPQNKLVNTIAQGTCFKSSFFQAISHTRITQAKPKNYKVKSKNHFPHLDCNNTKKDKCK